MMSEQKYVTIDIGGTAIKFGLADADGRLLERDSRPTLAKEEGGEGIVRKAVEIVQQYQKRISEHKAYRVPEGAR